MSVDLCYVLSHGFAARMVLQSAILPALRQRGVSVAVITPSADEAPMQALAQREGFTLVPPPVKATKLQNFVFHRSQRYFFEDISRNPALRAKHGRELASTNARPVQRWIPRALLQLNRVAVAVPAVPATAKVLQDRLLASPAVARMLAQLAPRAVVSTYPVNFLEAAVLYEAKRAGITTVGHLLSWDNITCKGRFPVEPDHYLSWGPIMTEELADYYAVPASAVDECGVPHFDAHIAARDRARDHANEALRALGLAPAKPYLFFGLSSPYFAPHEIDIVEWLARRVDAGDFGDVQLVVRPHPQNMQGSMADRAWLPRLAALASPRVAIDYPQLETSKLAWAMSDGDLPRLASLLAGCAICVNSGSTLSIDAIVHDRPVVITGFDAGHTLPWWQSARRVLEYRHIEKLNALGGTRVTTDFAALEAAIRAYLADPTLDAAGRARTREAECGACDGHAAERAAAALAGVVAKGA